MAKASKLPSGRWRVNLYLGKKNGKEIRKSITGRTKKEAEQNAALYVVENHLDDSPMTIGEAIEKYIMGISASASPATLRTYRNVQKYYVAGIEPYMADSVKSDDLQAWINALSQKYSAKTVAIAVKLVDASIKAVRPNFRMSAKLPQDKADIVLIPTKDEVKELIGVASKRMRRAIMLGAYCGMRRGEISFIRYHDIKNGCISIHGDVVPTPGGEWQFKETAKTDKSNRTIRVPDFVLQELGEGEPEQRVVPLNPNTISVSFKSYCKKFDLPYHFHLLRHFFASELIAQGIPREYVQALGGWESGNILDKIYTHILQTSKNEYSKKVADYFSEAYKG